MTISLMQLPLKTAPDWFLPNQFLLKRSNLMKSCITSFHPTEELPISSPRNNANNLAYINQKRGVIHATHEFSTSKWHNSEYFRIWKQLLPTAGYYPHFWWYTEFHYSSRHICHWRNTASSWYECYSILRRKPPYSPYLSATVPDCIHRTPESSWDHLRRQFRWKTPILRRNTTTKSWSFNQYRHLQRAAIQLQPRRTITDCILYNNHKKCSATNHTKKGNRNMLVGDVDFFKKSTSPTSFCGVPFCNLWCTQMKNFHFLLDIFYSQIYANEGMILI